jgi:formylglycine-generating enzyme required for sulfatase activity
VNRTAGWLLFVLSAAGPATAGEIPPAGTVFRDCPGCPELVVIAVDSLAARTAARESAMVPSPAPTIVESFALGRYEVTFDEWQACANAGACRATPDDHGWGRGRRPVINVTFADVGAYLAWLAQTTGRPYRLPTEAEWDYANRGGSDAEYWWGDGLGSGRANCRDCGSSWDGTGTAPVGSFAANPFGVFDTAGNVLEWVEDCWQSDRADRSRGNPAREHDSCRQRVVRGGSWYHFGTTLRAAWRSHNDSRAYSYTVGFRVARNLP